MRRIFVGVIFVSLFCGLVAQPDGYYDSAEDKYGEVLQSSLHDIIDNHTVVSYASLWQHFQVSDIKPDGKVWDMYSDIPGGAPPYDYTFVSDQCGNYSGEGSCYNREHSFPKSWFNDKSPMNTDMFHLYPTDGYVNGRRSNYPYGETDQASWTSLNGSKVGNCSFEGYTGTIFEPIDAYKGDFARSYFYMSTRYLGEDSGWPGSPMFDGAQPEPWAVNLLLEWHRNDGVSDKELDRNEAVYGIQKNRNPFIDRPEFVERIWGNADSTATAPLIDSISLVSESMITVWYDRIMDPATSLNKDNYVLNNNATVHEVSQHGLDFSAVDLSVEFPQNGTYVLSVSNVADTEGIEIEAVDVSFNVQSLSAPEKQMSRIDIFPNPSSGTLQISVGSEFPGRHIRIFSTSGQVIYDSPFLKDIALNLSHHPEGVYLIKITEGSGMSSMHKIILQ